ncbi:MAG: SbcC/MukB-like Walker B domain-containing protein [Clostridiaceae bacterium]|nr:SbcC/MukB-like Walker B domain-containing protein [Clostridiaceae bacterium]
MKLLKKLVLINWHYFWNEVIDFEDINFLTGKNAAGKSTIIDAFQLLLLGDTNGHFFNKAANEKSTRTIKGYLRGEIGDDGDVGFRYLRNGRFSSYIACEFYDDIKNKSFTLGVVFDCYEDGTDEHRFFVLDSGIPENQFVHNKVPMTYKELRSYVLKNYKRGKFDFPETNRGYQDILKGKLGGLKNKYFSLFKKAVPFTPITNIETFITEYVCDIKSPVDISIMRDNIRSYKRLEYEADMIANRIQALENIAVKFAAYSEERQRYEIQSYIIDRAEHQSAADRLMKLKEEIGKNEEEIARLSKDQAKCSVSIVELKQEKDKLTADKLASDINRKREELELRKQALKAELEELNNMLKKTVNNMRKYGLVWRECIKKLGDIAYDHREDHKLAEFEAISDDWEKLCGCGNQALRYAEMLIDISADRLCSMGESGFKNIRDNISQLKGTASDVNHSLRKLEDRARKRCEETEVQLSSLEKGIKPYDNKLLELKKEIGAALFKKTGKPVEIHILAELLEIKDVRWSNAVEAYLHTQKYYLLVEPEHFIDALVVYDRLKFQKGFYDWGIIDTGKLSRLRADRLEGSLAEEVLTDNEYARLFIDYVMGRLIKCESVEQLREHERAITDSCMLYQNFVARQLNPERWKYPYIGRKAIEEQIKTKRQELEALEKTIVVCGVRLAALQSINGMEIMNANEVESTLNVVSKSANIEAIESEYNSVLKELGAIDLTWLIKLEDKIRELEDEIKELERRERKLNDERVGLKKETDIIERTNIPQGEHNVRLYLEKINNRYRPEWIMEKGEPRFLKEIEMRSSAAEVYSNFYSQVARTEKQADKKKEDLVSARSDYNRDYKMSYDINESENTFYNKELDELNGVKLPEYRKQIQDAKEKAYDQFRDDFLAKLKSSIDTVKNQIDELNGALKESSFGSDRYRFVSNPKAEYRRYYDMITDEMLMEGHNISSQIFRDKHKDAIDELFRQITDTDSELNADARAEIEKSISRFTDYRTYLNFDLIVTDEEDRNQRLSKTLHKKSGGETQTPFYISVLASFAQLYRIKHKNESSNTMRLIIFDEAFSKMDSERIQESIKLLRRFGLQAILSAPPEKIGDIAPLVDRNLCVIRSSDSSVVKAFDSKKLLEESADGL